MAQTKLAWQNLDHNNTNIPEDVRLAVQALAEAREAVEEAVREAMTAPKGRKWTFSYRYGVAIALADGAPANAVNYFAKG